MDRTVRTAFLVGCAIALLFMGHWPIALFLGVLGLINEAVS